MLNAIKLKVRTRDLSFDEQTLTTGSMGMKIYFSFSADWDNLSKIVVFKAGDVVELVSIPSGTDNIVIPNSLFSIENLDKELIVGVYGYNYVNELVIPTTYQSLGIIELGAQER